MRYMRIQNVPAGSVLGHDLFDTQGRMVVARGCALSAKMLQRLQEYGYSHIYIDDKISSDIEIEPMISPELKNEGMRCIADMDLDKAMDIAQKIVDEIMEKGITTLNMSDLRAYDDYTFGHSVNVAVLSCIIGISMDLSENELEDIVLAGLLHDIGKLRIPVSILNKETQLTKEEFDLMKSHARESYNLISDRPDISSFVKNAVLLHHENEDGSGYPCGISGDELPKITKIIHIADIYDALVADRAYKEGYSPYEAIEYLMGASGILVDREIVSYFIQVVPLHPKGTEVMLSNGDKAIIVENSGIHNLRPVVRIVNTSLDIDLSERQFMNLTILEGSQAKAGLVEDREEKRHEMLKPLKRVLAVDDMETNLKILEDILHEDYRVDTVTNGKDALVYLSHNEAPDLIIMDIDMPELNGIDTTRQIQALFGTRIPILFITAICNKETVLTCKEMHAAGYIAKPFQNFYVRKEVDRIIAEWSFEY